MQKLTLSIKQIAKSYHATHFWDCLLQHLQRGLNKEYFSVH